jgi:hypothetical protein
MCLLALACAAYAQYLRNQVCTQPVMLGRKKEIGTTEFLSILFVVLSGLPFLIVAALRYRVGTDYAVYLSRQVPEVMVGDYHRVETLYRYLIQFAAYMMDGRSYQMIFVLTHLLIVGFVFASIRRLSWDYRFSILVLFLTGWYNFSLNIMRQSIAVAIFLYAMRYIMEKKPVRYFIAITVGVFFHTTAVLFYPMYFAGVLKVKKRYIVPLLILCYITKDYVVLLIEKIAGLLGYGKYFNNEFNFQTMQKGLLVYNAALLLLVFFGLWYFHSEKERTMEPALLKRYDNLLVNTQVITTLLCLWAEIIPNSTRIIYSFIGIQIILMPRVLRDQAGRDKRLFWLYRLAILGIYLVMFVKMILIRNIGETNIYHSIFSLL